VYMHGVERVDAHHRCTLGLRVDVAAMAQLHQLRVSNAKVSTLSAVHNASSGFRFFRFGRARWRLPVGVLFNHNLTRRREVGEPENLVRVAWPKQVDPRLCRRLQCDCGVGVRVAHCVLAGGGRVGGRGRRCRASGFSCPQRTWQRALALAGVMRVGGRGARWWARGALVGGVEVAVTG
jgi:hypothetical protein